MYTINDIKASNPAPVRFEDFITVYPKGANKYSKVMSIRFADGTHEALRSRPVFELWEQADDYCELTKQIEALRTERRKFEANESIAVGINAVAGTYRSNKPSNGKSNQARAFREAGTIEVLTEID